MCAHLWIGLIREQERTWKESRVCWSETGLHFVRTSFDTPVWFYILKVSIQIQTAPLAQWLHEPGIQGFDTRIFVILVLLLQCARTNPSRGPRVRFPTFASDFCTLHFSRNTAGSGEKHKIGISIPLHFIVHLQALHTKLNIARKNIFQRTSNH